MNRAFGAEQYNKVNLRGLYEDGEPASPFVQVPIEGDAVLLGGVEHVPGVKADAPYVEVVGFQMVLEMAEKRPYRSLQ